MFNSIYSPGSIVMVLMDGYKHYAIVSNRIFNGKPMLISLSRRTGTVKEEPWHVCAGAREVILSPEQGNISPSQVLARARSAIDKLRWDFFKLNCEHFVRGVHGLEVASKQLRNGFLAVTGIALLFFAAGR